MDFNDTPLRPLTLAGLTIAGTTALAAAYFAGVRYVPLLVGGTVIANGIGGVLLNKTEQALVFGLPALLVLGAFYWQIRRAAERPPRDPWETRWHKWRPGIILLLHAMAELIPSRLTAAVTRFRDKSPTSSTSTEYQAGRTCWRLAPAASTQPTSLRSITAHGVVTDLGTDASAALAPPNRLLNRADFGHGEITQESCTATPASEQTWLPCSI